MLKENLLQLGFSEKETDIYLALNRLGPSLASTLARVTNIKRTSIYDVINSLLKKNVIISYKQGNYTYFVIDDINKILYKEKEKVKTAESLVKELKENQLLEGNIQINYYTGEEGYRQIYEDILIAQPKELLVWVHLDNFHKALDPVREEQWTLERVQKKIYARLLMQDTPYGEAFKKEDSKRYRKTVLIPKEYMFKTSCFLYDNHIVFFDSRGNITGIRIQHPDFYQMHKQIFEMNWNLFQK